MSEEQQVLADTPALEQEITANPAPEEVSSPVETPVEAAKTFTQEELDAAIGKRLAREQRKWERELQQKSAELVVDVPPIEQFDSPEDYAEARALKILEQREQLKQKAALSDAYQDREEKAREKYDDFAQVAYNRNLSVTEVMADVIQQSEIGPDIIYHLGSNPKEASRIAALSPYLQAKEIGKIEAKLASEPPTNKVSNAPAPIRPIKAAGSGNPTYDTTDPRSVKSMSTSEWIEAERRRQIAKAEAQQRIR